MIGVIDLTDVRSSTRLFRVHVDNEDAMFVFAGSVGGAVEFALASERVTLVGNSMHIYAVDVRSEWEELQGSMGESVKEAILSGFAGVAEYDDEMGWTLVQPSGSDHGNTHVSSDAPA